MKTVSEIEDKISDLQTELNPIANKLDAEVIAFSNELISHVKEWMEKELTRKIGDNAEMVNAEGINFLKETKASFNTLINTIPNICENAIENKHSWPHRITESTSTNKPTNKETFFAASFRRAINPLGKLLDANKLLGTPTGHVATWERTKDGEFRYSINPGFASRNFNSVQAYQELRSRHDTLTKEIESNQKELVKAKALELWNEA
jgi:hypothetical protein